MTQYFNAIVDSTTDSPLCIKYVVFKMEHTVISRFVIEYFDKKILRYK